MEMIDLYDDNKQLMGKQVSRDIYPLPEGNVLLVHLCIFNSKGEMLIQHRSTKKRRYPGWWDASAGGFAKSGETSEQAVIREAEEELGITDLEGMGFAVCARIPMCFDDFYYIQKDYDLDKLVLQPEEVTEVRWASKEELLEMQKRKEFVDYNLPLMNDLFRCVGK